MTTSPPPGRFWRCWVAAAWASACVSYRPPARCAPSARSAHSPPGLCVTCLRCPGGISPLLLTHVCTWQTLPDDPAALRRRRSGRRSASRPNTRRHRGPPGDDSQSFPAALRKPPQIRGKWRRWESNPRNVSAVFHQWERQGEQVPWRSIGWIQFATREAAERHIDLKQAEAS
jgi:hypothetical protein